MASYPLTSTLIKIQKLQWGGHIHHIKDGRKPKNTARTHLRQAELWVGHERNGWIQSIPKTRKYSI